ncbi:hypothetical protein [Streptomyces sp. NBC_00140]|uniref:hypothetical protein n=1 Tax=Streptomyces sp. NBC_00140 TaxID=2975664 RepID=UPI0022549540|nr:hypothetical protein [Streptomyces sp. NBC_00140]MCX5336526.1 hypothetical protein [Streptomyces sp. NBC_00140]
MTAPTGHGTLRRVAAGLAVISAFVHAAMLRQHVDRFAVVLLVLALTCLGCAVMLWRSSGPGEWAAMAMLNVVMLTTHVLWPAVQPAMDHTNRLHNHYQSGSLTLMHAALALAVVETLLAVAGLFGALLGEQREITGKNAASPGASGVAPLPRGRRAAADGATETAKF